MAESILRNKSYLFSVRIFGLSRRVRDQYKEYDAARQLMRSGTSVGANVRESEYAQSKADFINKLAIALKEANETSFWLDVLRYHSLIEQNEYDELSAECETLLKLLTASINTARKNSNT